MNIFQQTDFRTKYLPTNDHRPTPGDGGVWRGANTPSQNTIGANFMAPEERTRQINRFAVFYIFVGDHWEVLGQRGKAPAPMKSHFSQDVGKGRWAFFQKGFNLYRTN